VRLQRPNTILITIRSRSDATTDLNGIRIQFGSVASRRGVVKEGAYADLLLVDGNPLENVKVLEDYGNNIMVIMKDGVIYKNTLAE
jgi:hypothetical protein